MARSPAESDFRSVLDRGVVIPASPLALTAERKFDPRRQKALWRYYRAAGAGGVAIGVHTTQFAIRDPKIALLKPLLELAADELAGADDFVRIAGVCGPTDQATREATLAQNTGFDAALLSLAAMKDANEDQLIAHCNEIGQVIPLMGFYLQPAAGGRVLSHGFWRRFAEIESVVAIKMAPFDRYRTIDVVRAVAESGRDDIALYTGNDDNIVADLLTPYRFEIDGKQVERRIVGGLLGHWAVWTKRAVELLNACHRVVAGETMNWPALLRIGVEVTDANAALFDAANDYAGCIPGIHEILRRQGILAGTWCLDPAETFGPGQTAQIDRVCRAYPHLNDDAFVTEHLDEWLAG